MGQRASGRAVALVMAGALAGTVAGCGSGTSTTTTGTGRPASPAVVLAAAYGRAVSSRTADVTLMGKVSVAGTSYPVTASGAVGFDPSAADITEKVSEGGQSLDLRFLVVAGHAYVHLPAEATGAAGGKSWIEATGAGAGTTGALDPTQSLRILESKATSVTRVGPSTIGGVATTEYRAQVSPATLLAAAGRTVAQFTGTLPASLPVEVWIDAQGRPRQLSFTLSLPGSPDSAGSEVASIAVTEDISNYGVALPTITAPPADQVQVVAIPGSTTTSTTAPAVTG